MRAWASAVFATLFLVSLLAWGAYLFVMSGFDSGDLVLRDSARIYDRNVNLPQVVPDNGRESFIRIASKDIPMIVKCAFIAAEDERFYRHFGFDIAAVLRAAMDNMSKRRIVSDASTITQRLSRLVYPTDRSYIGKFIEAVRSIRIELSLSKDEIIERYLNLVPMGNNIKGVELASRVYFGKKTSELTAPEAALLASLPRAPGLLNPYGKNRERLLERKNWVLSRMAALGYILEDDLRELMSQELVFLDHRFQFEAPHLAGLLPEYWTEEERRPADRLTTIDAGIEDYLQVTTDNLHM